MKCPKCGSSLPYGAVSCRNCGAKFKTAKCPYCGKDVIPGSHFCPACRKDIKCDASNAQGVSTVSPKKPLTKRWWFWTVCVVLVIGVIGNIGNAINGSKSKPEKTDLSQAQSVMETPVPTNTPVPTETPLSSSTPNSTVTPSEKDSPESKLSGTASKIRAGGANNFDTYDNADQQNTSADYALNTKSMKVHYLGCSSVKKIAPQNYKEFFGTIDEALSEGYSKCGVCFN